MKTINESKKLTKDEYNENCIKYDCDQCHGFGYIRLWRGYEQKIVKCNGKGIIKKNCC
jgi:hypothetical protein